MYQELEIVVLDTLMYPPVGYLTTSASPVSQMLIDVFYLPLKRWAEEQSSRAGRQAVDISLSDIDKVFSNVRELIVFSRWVCTCVSLPQDASLSVRRLLSRGAERRVITESRQGGQSQHLNDKRVFNMPRTKQYGRAIQARQGSHLNELGCSQRATRELSS